MGVKKYNFVLGDLETTIMEVLWHKKSASVREVLAILRARRTIAYTTVMTVMGRLYEKGILQRNLMHSGAYLYKPIQTRDMFLQDASKHLIRDLLKEYGEVAIAQFIDILESEDVAAIKEWKKKLEKLT